MHVGMYTDNMHVGMHTDSMHVGMHTDSMHFDVIPRRAVFIFPVMKQNICVHKFEDCLERENCDATAGTM